MEVEHKPRSPFPTTHWSLIGRAASADPVDRDKALAEICRLYWPPVYAFIRSRGHPPHDAEDLTQGFFAGLLKRDDFAKADANHGRLRSYLLTAAKNHLNSEHRRQHRLKRGGDVTLISMDASVEEHFAVMQLGSDDWSPERVFHREWAVTVMKEVARRLERRYQDKDQGDLFEHLRGYITTEEAVSAQREVAARLGMSGQAFRVAVHRLRQRYRDELHAVVKSTLGSEESLEDELRQLMNAFA